MKKTLEQRYTLTYGGYRYDIFKKGNRDYRIYTDTKSYGYYQCATAGTLEGCRRMVKEWHKWRILHSE